MNDLEDPEAKEAYNMVVFKNGIIIMLREKEKYQEKISINGFIMVGSLGTTKKEMYNVL